MALTVYILLMPYGKLKYGLHLAVYILQGAEVSQVPIYDKNTTLI